MQHFIAWFEQEFDLCSFTEFLQYWFKLLMTQSCFISLRESNAVSWQARVSSGSNTASDSLLLRVVRIFKPTFQKARKQFELFWIINDLAHLSDLQSDPPFCWLASFFFQHGHGQTRESYATHMSQECRFVQPEYRKNPDCPSWYCRCWCLMDSQMPEWGCKPEVHRE